MTGVQTCALPILLQRDESKYVSLRQWINCLIKKMFGELGADNAIFYTARKTFAQIGQEVGVPLHVLEYLLGHSVSGRQTIFKYFQTKQRQADKALRQVIDSVDTFNPDSDD